ncbi:MAG: hypothetical protein ACKVQA_16965 [Burkholderiales bacterium]
MLFRLIRWLDFPKLTFLILFLVLITLAGLGDPDYFWHLKSGEYLVSHGFPKGDPFSFTFEGRPWILHEWLFQVGLFGVFSLAGDLGVRCLTALLSTLAIYIAYRAAARLLGSTTLALVIALAFTITTKGGFTPRPQLVTYVFFAFFIYSLVAFKYLNEDRWLWFMPPAAVLWVNGHGGYMIGLFVLGLFVASEWIMYWIRPIKDATYRGRLSRLTVIALVSGLATAVNPEFFRHWLYPFEVMKMTTALSMIQEWQSPNFHQTTWKIFLALVFGYLAAWTYRPAKPDLTEYLLPASMLFAGFVSVRHLPLVALILVPFTAVALRDSPLRPILDRRIRQGTDLGVKGFALNWVILIVVSLVLLLPYPKLVERSNAKIEGRLPVKAAEFVRKQGIGGRMFNGYAEGGYLIHALYPNPQVFIDGRADLYGDQFLREFLEIYWGGPYWETLFAKYRIDFAVLPNEAPIRQLLLARGGFDTAYHDDHHSVLVRRGAAFPAASANQ